MKQRTQTQMKQRTKTKNEAKTKTNNEAKKIKIDNNYIEKSPVLLSQYWKNGQFNKTFFFEGANNIFADFRYS